MAREATARLYDVDANSVVMKRLTHTGRYDTGTITFRAQKGKLLDLDQLHESVWATRLSRGTRSGLVSLEVTAIGTVEVSGSDTILRVDGSIEHFVLAEDPNVKPADGKPSSLLELRKAFANGTTEMTVTGRLDGWSGVWPSVLRELPPKPRRVLVTGFEPVRKS